MAYHVTAIPNKSAQAPVFQIPQSIPPLDLSAPEAKPPAVAFGPGELVGILGAVTAGSVVAVGNVVSALKLEKLECASWEPEA